MIKNLIIITLVIVIIYLYYQHQNLTASHSDYPALQAELAEVKKINRTFALFCQNEIGGRDIQEIRTKLNGRTLAEVLEDLVSAQQENED